MKLPRDLSGRDLARAFSRLGYQMKRQAGSHMRLTTQTPSEHHVTIPDHDSIKIGTLNAIIKDIAAHHGMTRDELLRRLFE